MVGPQSESRPELKRTGTNLRKLGGRFSATVRWAWFCRRSFYAFPFDAVEWASRRLQWASRTGWLVPIPLLILAVVVIWLWPGIRVPIVDATHPHALYLLSAIAQSLAAILAIIFTITLVAAQLSSRYSHRMLADFFDFQTVLYILLLILAVLLPFGLLAEPNPTLVKLSLTLAIASLLFLIPYFLRFRDKLKPERIPLELRQKAVRELQAYPVLEPDTVADIHIFVMNAFVLKDYDTFNVGVKALADLVIDTYLAQVKADAKADADEFMPLIPGAPRPKFYPTQIGLLERLRDIALVTLEDAVAPRLVVNALGGIFTKGIQQHVGAAASDATEILGDIGLAAIEKRMERTIDMVTEALKNICADALEKDLHIMHNAADHLKEIATGAAEKGLVTVVKRAAEHLGRIGVRGIRAGWTDLAVPTYPILRSLRKIPTQGRSFIAKVAADLGNIGTTAADKCPQGTRTAVKQLWEMGAWATSKENVDLKGRIANSVKRIEEKAGSGLLLDTYDSVKANLEGSIGNALTEFKAFYEAISCGE